MSKSSAQGACPGDEQAVPEDVPPKTPRTDGSAVLESSPCSTPRKVNGRGRKRRLSLSLPKGAGAGAPAPAPTPQEGGAGAIVPPASEDDMDDSEDDNDISFTQISDSVDSTGGQPSSTVGVFSELGFSQGEPTSPLPAPIIDRVVPAGGAASGSLFSQESIVQFPSPSLAGLQSPTYLSLGSRMSMDGSATGGSQEHVVPGCLPACACQLCMLACLHIACKACLPCHACTRACRTERQDGPSQSKEEERDGERNKR